MATAADGRLPGGPVKSRELLTPYIVFLSPLPEAAELLGRGGVRIDLSISESNSFAGTNGFRSLTHPIAGNRLVVDQTLIIDTYRFINAGEDLFYVDGEVLWADLSFRVGVHDRLDFGIDLPLIGYGGGFLDSLIEDWHHRFGFPNDGRPAFERDTFDLALFLGSTDLFVDGPPARFGLGDVTLSAKTSLYRDPRRGLAVAGTGYLKLPTGSEEKLFGSGHYDAGLQVFLSHRFPRQAYHLSAGYAALGDWALAPAFDPAASWFGSGTYEVLLGRGVTFLWQTAFTTSPYRKETDEDLADPSLRVNAGFRWTRGNGFMVDLMMEENFARTNASADVGFHVGIGYRFGTAGTADGVRHQEMALEKPSPGA